MVCRYRVQGALELLQEVVDEPGPAALVRGVLEQVLHEQGLVAGGGHLGHKDHIVPVHRGLISVGQVGVDRVAQLMGQGEHAVQVVLIVQENIGVNHGAGHVSPGALARILVHVDPPVVQALPDDGLILLAQGSHRLIDGLFGLLIGNLGVHPGHHGGVHVVHVEFLHPQQLLSQPDVPVHLVQIGPDGGDQVVVDGLRHPGARQGGGQGAGVLPGGGEELQLLHLGGEGGGQGVLHPPIDGVQVLKGGFPQRPVLTGHEKGVRAVGQRMALPLGIHRFGEGEIRVGQF